VVTAFALFCSRGTQKVLETIRDVELALVLTDVIVEGAGDTLGVGVGHAGEHFG